MTSAVMVVAQVPARVTLDTGVGDSIKWDSFHNGRESESVICGQDQWLSKSESARACRWISSCGIPSTIIISHVKIWFTRIVDDILNYNSD
jgi:hypothetical protein